MPFISKAPSVLPDTMLKRTSALVPRSPSEADRRKISVTTEMSSFISTRLLWGWNTGELSLKSSTMMDSLVCDDFGGLPWSDAVTSTLYWSRMSRSNIPFTLNTPSLDPSEKGISIFFRLKSMSLLLPSSRSTTIIVMTTSPDWAFSETWATFFEVKYGVLSLTSVTLILTCAVRDKHAEAGCAWSVAVTSKWYKLFFSRSNGLEFTMVPFDKTENVPSLFPDMMLYEIMAFVPWSWSTADTVKTGELMSAASETLAEYGDDAKEGALSFLSRTLM